MAKVDEITKLKHWVDSEFSVMHIYVLVVILLLTEGLVPNLIVGFLIFMNGAYTLRRAIWIVEQDKNYLKLDK